MYDDRLQSVGSFEQGRSSYGVYDMAGNVWEWVADWYAEDYYETSPEKNPQGPKTGEAKALRGGSWYTTMKFLRPATRGRNVPTYRDSSEEYDARKMLNNLGLEFRWEISESTVVRHYSSIRECPSRACLSWTILIDRGNLVIVNSLCL